MFDSATLGRYKILNHIGVGACADVFKAEDPVLGRIVALKVLKPSLVADSEAFGRFQQEARTLGSLFHSGIATVLDIGEQGGRYFIAMRFVAGKSLDQIVASRGPLPWQEAMAVMDQIGTALEFAHRQGFLHRDVKPQNIIVGPEGAVLTDFGLAKALQHTVIMTTAGSLLGTPAYMAPEIWEGADATAATDQYALACVLVEMLTGIILFDGKTPPAVMAQHFQPLELPARWPADVPPGITEVVTRALARAPMQRYSSVSAFLSALHKLYTQNLHSSQQESYESPPYSAPSIPAPIPYTPTPESRLRAKLRVINQRRIVEIW